MNTNRLILKKETAAKCYECLATVRKASDRPDIEVAMKLLARYKRLSPEVIQEHLLPGKPRAMANNLFRRYFELGFIDEEGYPRQFGEYAISGEIYLPERGKYRICSTDDPLVEQGVVSLTYSMSQKNNATENGRKQDHPEGKPGIIPLPSSIKAGLNKRISLWSDKLNDVYIEEIDRNVTSLNERLQISVEVVLESDSTLVNLQKKNSKEIISMNSFNTLNLRNLWEIIAKMDTLKNWKGGPLDQGVLSLKFNQLSPEEIYNFERTIKSHTIEIPGLGQYLVQPFSVKIAPFSRSDANMWARVLLTSQINDYQTPDSFQMLIDSVTKKFPRFDLEIPDIEETIDLVKQSGNLTETERLRKFWYLQAPLDLAEVD